MAGPFPCPANTPGRIQIGKKNHARPDSDREKKPRPAEIRSEEKSEKINAKNHARPMAAERQNAKNEKQKATKKNRPTG
jgi:hypothetical protein